MVKLVHKVMIYDQDWTDIADVELETSVGTSNEPAGGIHLKEDADDMLVEMLVSLAKTRRDLWKRALVRISSGIFSPLFTALPPTDADFRIIEERKDVPF